MKKIIFARHAESEANAGGISKPNEIVELTETGLSQAQLLADEWLEKPSQIYVSKFIRTTQTATPLMQKYDMEPVEFSGLNEFNTFGYEFVEGLTGEERLPLAIAYWEEADPDARKGETGQTYNEFCAQVEDFIPTLFTLENNSAIVGHGLWITQLMWQTLGFGSRVSDSQSMKAYMKFHMALHVGNTQKFNLYLTDDKVFVQKHD
ncbi:histidine phosphatase family protein [Wohlfahrtiimonas larvae]|uniref:Histidine phosphatase family protein n=1 Tax=Wohlfahrtiimonas larvae TaxID=1157986 RepID=A0ABP9MF65_9GAMM|nr:histidine phosphatase family protein [Wohlfahrtiimonas larvae]